MNEEISLPTLIISDLLDYPSKIIESDVIEIPDELKWDHFWTYLEMWFHVIIDRIYKIGLEIIL